MKFVEVVQRLESRGIMPKTKPGLEKIRAAVVQKPWFNNLDTQKIVTVAGTNGKGTTCACLETLLISANQRVGLYTSPHLIQTTERIRIQGVDINEEEFCRLFESNLPLIESCELSHFESLTLMAADYFFSEQFRNNLDYAIFEVGLGGTFDATNIFPNAYAVITALSLDHVDILGKSLREIAENKFGIVKTGNVVVHQKIEPELEALKSKTQARTKSTWVETKSFRLVAAESGKNDSQSISSPWGLYSINLLGERAAVNSMTALTLFEKMGFNPETHMSGLIKVRWSGRMQKVHLAKYGFDIYLSGDHNPQGVNSLLEIMRNFDVQGIHFIVGIGKDKNAEQMLRRLFDVPRAKIYLTETPFKGTALADYPMEFRTQSELCDPDIEKIFSYIKENQPKDNQCIVVTGSLYLVGQVLKEHKIVI